MKNLKNKIRNGIVTGLALVIFGCSHDIQPEVFNRIEKTVEGAYITTRSCQYTRRLEERFYDSKTKQWIYFLFEKDKDLKNRIHRYYLTVEYSDSGYQKGYEIIVDYNKKKITKIKNLGKRAR